MYRRKAPRVHLCPRSSVAILSFLKEDMKGIKVGFPTWWIVCCFCWWSSWSNGRTHLGDCWKDHILLRPIWNLKEFFLIVDQLFKPRESIVEYVSDERVEWGDSHVNAQVEFVAVDQVGVTQVAGHQEGGVGRHVWVLEYPILKVLFSKLER